MKDKNTEEEEQDTTVTSTSSTPQQPAKSDKLNLKRPHSSHADTNSHHDLHSSSKKAKTSTPHVAIGKSTFKVIDCSAPPANHDKDTDSPPPSGSLKNKDNSCQEAVSSEADAPNTLATKFQLPSRDSFSYSSSSRVLKCPSCNKFFVNVAELIDHSCYPSPCTLCNLNFKTKSELNNHYERVHNRTKSIPVPIQDNGPAPQVSSAETHIQNLQCNGLEPHSILSGQKVLSKKMETSVMSSKKAKGSPTRFVSLGKLMKTLKRFEPKGAVGLAIGEISRFRCVRCDHFFINCKQICMHYKNCKLPFNRNRPIKDRNIRWLCLQCHSSFTSRSEVQEHMKITCTTEILKTLFQLPAPSTISSSNESETPRLNTEPVHNSSSSKQSTMSTVETSAKKKQVRINTSNRKKSVTIKVMKIQESIKFYCPECGTACFNRRSLSHHGCASNIKYMTNCNVYVERLDFEELHKLIKRDGTIKNVRELMKGKGFNKTYQDLHDDQIKQEVLSDEAPEYFPCARSQFHVNVFTTHASRLERLGYFCECRQLFSSLEKFSFHAKIKHGFEITYDHCPHVCAYCFSQFFTPVSLKLHDCEFYRKEFLQERDGAPVSNKPRLASSSSKACTVLPVNAGKQASADVQITRNVAGSARGPCTISQPRLSASSTESQPNVDHSIITTIDNHSVVKENMSSTDSVSPCLAPQEPSVRRESSSEQCSTLESNLRTRSESLLNEESASTAAACNKSKEVPTSAKESLGQLRLASILPNLQSGGTSRRLSLQRIEFERQLRAAGVHPHSSLLKEFFEFHDKPSQNLADVQHVSENSIDILPGTPESMADPPSEPSKDALDATPPLLETCEKPECHPNFNPKEERVEFGTFSSPDAWCIEDTNITNCSSETGKLAEKYVCSKCYLTYIDKDSLAAHYNSTHSSGTEGPVRIQVFDKESKFSN